MERTSSTAKPTCCKKMKVLQKVWQLSGDCVLQFRTAALLYQVHHNCAVPVKPQAHPHKQPLDLAPLRVALYLLFHRKQGCQAKMNLHHSAAIKRVGARKGEELPRIVWAEGVVRVRVWPLHRLRAYHNAKGRHSRSARHTRHSLCRLMTSGVAAERKRHTARGAWLHSGTGQSTPAITLVPRGGM